MFQNITSTKLFIKVSFDGYDFIQSELGRVLVPTHFDNFIKKYTFAQYSDIEPFIKYCVDKYKENRIDYIPNELMKKYRVGVYSLKDSEDINNPWKDRDYVLMNSKRLKNIYKFCNINPETMFWVCPGMNGIGFRIINTNQVESAFKWLFPAGNNIIYGNPDKTKRCYIVEGFRDYVALNECGYNVIGLGSIEISESQKEFIDTLYEPILLLDNDNYGLKKTLQYNKYYKVATLIKSNYKDAYDTWINNQPINIVQIQ